MFYFIPMQQLLILNLFRINYFENLLKIFTFICMSNEYLLINKWVTNAIVLIKYNRLLKIYHYNLKGNIVNKCLCKNVVTPFMKKKK